MSEAKKYYWLKLKEDFFEEDAIAWLEEQPNGKEYSLFYLKLCLKSLKTNGLLVRNVGQMVVPYDIKTLSRITNTDVDTIVVAMGLFERAGLIQVLDNGEVYMSQLESMVGSETSKAQLMRNKRERDRIASESGNIVTQMLPESGNIVTQRLENRELENRELENRDLDKDKDIKNTCSRPEPKAEKVTAEEVGETEIQFEEFWKEYPKKTDKKNAMKKFERIVKKEPSAFGKMMDALKWQKRSRQWQDNNGQFVPMPSTWLNNARWEDEDTSLYGNGHSGSASFLDDILEGREGSTVNGNVIDV